MKHQELFEEIEKLTGIPMQYTERALAEAMYESLGTHPTYKNFAIEFVAYENALFIKNTREHKALGILAREMYSKIIDQRWKIAELQKEIEELKQKISKK